MPPSTSRPTTSAGGSSLYYQSQSYTGNTQFTTSSQFTEEDDDDGDVFAFLPPATAQSEPTPATAASEFPQRRLDSSRQSTTHHVDLRTPDKGDISATESVVPESREASIKMEFDFDAIDEEDSPYPEVRASVSNTDDPDMPALTVRMWIVGLGLCLISASLNVFFNFRQPAPSIVPIALLLLAHPFGKLLALVLPISTYRLSLPHLPVAWSPPSPVVPPSRISSFFQSILRTLCTPTCLEFSLNPGPWNIKEHVLVYIMSNVAITIPYALNAIVVAQQYYHADTSYWFTINLVLATQLTGFGLAGACRRFLVSPGSMVWPQNLVACTLLNTLHAEEDDLTVLDADGVRQRQKGTGISRYRFFLILFLATFLYTFLPGYLFKALSFFSFVCWAVPDNVVVNQLFGTVTGLGMSFLTFDWAQISWIGSPLMVPWWAQVHVFVGFVLFFWVLAPALYYTNTWNMAYFPISHTSPFDRFGDFYQVQRVLTPDAQFDPEKFAEYSPLFLPCTYAITYLLAFALATCVIVHTALYHGKTLYQGLRKIKVEPDDIHAKLMRVYPEAPDWWYFVIFIIFFCIGIIAVEVWDTSVPVWSLLLSVSLPVVYILPSGFIYAMTGQAITINIIAQILPGTLLPGNPLANMIFKAYSVQTLAEATSFVQDLKLGHYIKVPPRATFIVQGVATTIAAFVQVGIKYWIFDSVKDICSNDQPSQLVCPHNKVFFTASAIWGLVGPERQFGPESMYHVVVYALVIGAFLPLPFWLIQRSRPKSWVKYVSIPVLINGVSYIPPATGINYSSWFTIGFVFQYLIRRRQFTWWSKFNYVTSAALDSASVIGLIFIFLALQFPRNGEIEVKWWGNSVFKNTADARAVPYLKVPEGGIPLTNWPPSS